MMTQVFRRAVVLCGLGAFALAPLACGGDGGSGAGSPGGANGSAAGASGIGGATGGAGGAGGATGGAGGGAAGSAGGGAGGRAGTGGAVADAAVASDGPGPADASASGDAGTDATPASGIGPAGSICKAGQTYGSPLPANKTATRIPGGPFNAIEGPVWVAAQKALYFSNIVGTGTGGSIRKYTPAADKFEIFVTMVGTNGMAIDGKGMIVAAAHDMQRLARFDPATGERAEVPGSAMYMNRPFNSVNDVVVRQDGNIYFVDPNYQQGGRPGQDAMGYYRLSPAGQVTRIGAFSQPNGIALSPSGRILYVASSGGAAMLKYDLADDGSVMGDGKTMTADGSDGMAVDCAGNLYLTLRPTPAGVRGLVRVISPDGVTIGEINGFDADTTNAAFGGDDGTTLFVTAGNVLYQIKLNIPGMPN
jgi:gluconolactonase